MANKLSADATDEQIADAFFRDWSKGCSHAAARTAREYAEARVAAEREQRSSDEHARLTDLFGDPEDGEWCLDDGSGDRNAGSIDEALGKVVHYWGVVSERCEAAEFALQRARVALRRIAENPARAALCSGSDECPHCIASEALAEAPR